MRHPFQLLRPLGMAALVILTALVVPATALAQSTTQVVHEKYFMLSPVIAIGLIATGVIALNIVIVRNVKGRRRRQRVIRRMLLIDALFVIAAFCAYYFILHVNGVTF
jgi:cytochrome bd-type quinol oxidase subunit 2